MAKYIYGGHIHTAGKFDDGKAWESCRALLGKLPKGGGIPVSAIAVKVVNDDSLHDTLDDLDIGQQIGAAFDENGRLSVIVL